MVLPTEICQFAENFATCLAIKSNASESYITENVCCIMDLFWRSHRYTTTTQAVHGTTDGNLCRAEVRNHAICPSLQKQPMVDGARGRR